MANLELRPYQQAVVDATVSAWEAGDSRVCAWMPTGAGKTETALQLALQEQQAGGHTLFVVDRKVLAAQTASRFNKYGMLTAVIRGDDTLIRGYEPATVASIQTLRSRHAHAKVAAILDRTTLIVVDEAHVQYDHQDELFSRLSQARAVGLTATPLREGMGLRYQRLVRGPSSKWLIDNGYLVRPRYFMPSPDEVEAGLRSVAVKSTGDFQDAELSALMRRKTIMGDVVGNWKAKGEDRPTICFCVDVAHAQSLTDEFRAAGIEAEGINHKTPDDDRKRIFERFRRGDTRVLCSVAVLAVGFDEPQTSCVILAKPTLSLALHIQQVGRGLRIFNDKQDALVFDHAGNIRRHGMIEDFDPPELSDIGKRSDRKRRTDVTLDCRPCPNCSAVVEPRQRVCHECGHEFGRKSKVDFISVDLAELGHHASPAATTEAMRTFYRMSLWTAKARGKAPDKACGIAYFGTLERFKIAPEVAKAQRLIPWGWRSLEPLPPDDAYLRWEQSRRIARAKSRR